jgi:Skp family chaperone for outer membrane proteins
MDVAEAKLNTLRDCEMKIRERINQRQKEIADQKMRMQRRIVGKLREIVGKYSSEKGYTLVLDSSAMGISGVESVVYSKENLDVTEEVLKIINIGTPEKPDKPEVPEKKK